MKTVVKDLFRKQDEFGGKEITVSGWIRNIRISKNFGFIELNDGTFFKNLQIVIESDKLDNFAELSKLNIAAAITATGTLVLTPDAKQPFELKAENVVIDGESTPDYPLRKKRHSFEYLRTVAHLRPRTNTFSAVFRVRSMIAYAIHQFFQERGFVYVHTPIITASDCEGAGEMFQVTTLDLNNVPKNDDGTVDYSQDFFGKQANLTVSGQLNVETYCMAFRNVYTFGPTFRAENSNTTRHAAEFWMIEPEIAFADLKDDMELAEDMLKYIINYCLENAPEEMQFFNQFIDKELLDRLNHVVNSEFAHVTYTEAVNILIEDSKAGKVKFDNKVEWGCDLQTEHEKYLTEQVFGRPVVDRFNLALIFVLIVQLGAERFFPRNQVLGQRLEVGVLGVGRYARARFLNHRHRVHIQIVGVQFVAAEVDGIGDRVADDREQRDDDRKLNQQRQAAGKRVVAVVRIELLNLHIHLLLGGLVGAAGVFLADGHFLRTQFGHRDLRLLLLDAQREQHDL